MTLGTMALIIIILFFYFLFRWAFRLFMVVMIAKAVSSQVEKMKSKLGGKSDGTKQA